ncbi:hypothetical protein FQN57_002401 [Myotisia sp. PD_48]|nr:hypothetical protein FQN57_002401 [Myotisia sp. PD_48]
MSLTELLQLEEQYNYQISSNMRFSVGIALGLSCLANAATIPNEVETSSGIEARSAGNLRTVQYYTNWAIYNNPPHNPQNLDAKKYTHVLYAFADVRATGEVFLSDPWADLQNKYPTDKNEAGNNVYGCLKQLFLLKKKNRNMKTLLSIGGWTYSSHFKVPASTAAGRAKFAETSVKLLKDLGFDGIDVDWEYPENGTEPQDCVLLLKAIREALDAYSAKLPGRKKFLLTFAPPAGSSHYSKMKLKEMDAHLDFWNLMAYDYSGDWDTIAAHASNLYASKTSPASTPFNSERTVTDYLARGVALNKITLGMPLYGTQFKNTNGPGTPFNNKLAVDTSSASAAPEIIDLPEIGASYSYDKATRVMVSYDTLSNAKLKANYVVSKGMGGSMWWDSTGDVAGPTSRVTAVYDIFNAQGLEQRENELNYPDSVYDNLRAGFPGE